jgi:SAM-dependent methyltransferase
MQGRLERERHFHDARARELEASELPPRPPDPTEEAMVSGVRFRGLRVLDLGCGKGDLTLWLASQGADVTAVDLSPGMIEVTNERLAKFADGPARAIAAPVESLPFERDEFDLVIGKWILHHLDLGAAAPEIARVLKPGALGVFGETSASNPLLMVARKWLPGRFGIPRVGTEDERPIDAEAMSVLRFNFGSVSARHRPFVFFGMLDRQVLHRRWPAISKATGAVDSVLARIPILGRLSYFMVLTVRVGR